MRNRNHPGCPCCGGGEPPTGCLCADDTPIPHELTVTFSLGSVVVSDSAPELTGLDLPSVFATCAWFGWDEFTVAGVKCSNDDIVLKIGFLILQVGTGWEFWPIAFFTPAACFDSCTTINASLTWSYIPMSIEPVDGVDDTCNPVYGEREIPIPIEGFEETLCENWTLAVFPYGSTITLTT